MPYIKSKYRDELNDPNMTASNAGELNYLFTKIINEYLVENGPLRYHLINDIVGALEGAKAEFQRRIVNPYEDLKRQQNGDVYHESLFSRPDERDTAV
jgi:hypothetical protein